MGVSIHVSAYDVTSGVEERNEASKPYPRVVGGQDTWQLPSYSQAQPTVENHSVVSSANLLSVAGVTPRRSGNNYAVTRITGAPVDGTVVVNHSPKLDYVFLRSNSTLTYSKWVYVKKASGTDNIFGFGVGSYDSSFGNIGGGGDSVEGAFPSNQWVQVHYQQVYGALTGGLTYGNFVLPMTVPDAASGDVIISTDFLCSWGASLDYFDGNFAEVGNTVYSWTNVAEASPSKKVTSIPSSVLLFPPDNIIDYAVSEEAMSLDPSDFQGGYGSITFSIDDGRDVKLLNGKTFDLTDSDKGKVSGTVTGLDGSASAVSVTTDSALGLLNSWQTVAAYSGTFASYITYLFDLVGLNRSVRYDTDEIAERNILARGYVGNLWDWIKQFLAAQKVEMSLVFNDVVFRPYRTYEAYTGRESDANWSISTTETAKAVEVTYYQNEHTYSGEFYPVDYNTDEEPVIMQADANETVEYVLQLSGTPVSIQTPYAQYTVTDEPQTDSKYSITGSDELPIQPAQWQEEGGNLTVRISEDDPTQVIVTLKGANIPKLAPFRVAMSSGAGNYYNSLHLVGSGIKFTPQTVRIATGASRDTAGTDVGITVQNPHISTAAQAYDLGAHTAARYTGTVYTVSGTAWDINRAGYTGGVYPQVSDLNDSFSPGDTVADFNTRYSGVIVAEFNAQWDSTILETYAVQAFGNAAGARVREDDAFFRINSATFNPTDMSYSATMDTTVGDFNPIWDGATVADFNVAHNERLVRDFSVVPLRR